MNKISKEEILGKLNFGNQPFSSTAMKAMDEFAEQECIAFADFTRSFGNMVNKGLWSKNNGDYLPPSFYTTEQLYNLYLQSKTQQP